MLVAMCLIKAHIDEISDEHKVLVAQLCLTLCNPPGSFVHGNSPGKNTGVGSHLLLQGSFQQGLKPESPTV